MSRCEQENEDEEGADRIVDKNVRTRDDEPAFGTSQSRHYDHAISKSSIIDSSKTISYGALMHEHDFVQITPKNRKPFVRCVTCGANFCEVCGKVLDDGHILTDRRKCLALIQRIFL
jgi:hypothetical protein